MIIEESVCFMSCEPILFCDNSVFPDSNANDMRVTQDLNSFGKNIAHVHCSVAYSAVKREDRIICCQIICDLLLNSAFERIFNVMQLILVKIK
jgi:hypothetical protein